MTLTSLKVGRQRHYSLYLILTSHLLGRQNHFIPTHHKKDLTSADSTIIFVFELKDMCCYEKDH